MIYEDTFREYCNSRGLDMYSRGAVSIYESWRDGVTIGQFLTKKEVDNALSKTKVTIYVLVLQSLILMAYILWR